MTDELTRLSAAEIARRVRGKELSAVDAAEAFLGRAEKIGPALNTWITLDREGALREAQAVDEAVGQGKTLGPLAGVPVGLKDLIDVAGLRTTAGSQIYRDNVASEDAPITRMIRDAGAGRRPGLHKYGLSALWQTRPAGDGHDGHVRRLVLVPHAFRQPS